MRTTIVKITFITHVLYSYVALSGKLCSFGILLCATYVPRKFYASLQSYIASQLFEFFHLNVFLTCTRTIQTAILGKESCSVHTGCYFVGMQHNTTVIVTQMYTYVLCYYTLSQSKQSLVGYVTFSMIQMSISKMILQHFH